MIQGSTSDNFPSNRDVADDTGGAIVVLSPGSLGVAPARSRTACREWPVMLAGLAPSDAPGSRRDDPRSKQRAYRLRADVTIILQDQMARLVDFSHGRFFALDVIGTRMVLVALEQGCRKMVRTVARDYEVTEARVEQDWRGLLQDLRRSRLVEVVRHDAAGRGLPAGFGVWLRLTLAWISFRVFGWERTLRAWRCRGTSPAGNAAECAAATATVDRLVRGQSSRHPLNPQCKERALVAWRLLRQMGVPARLVMGVALYPFEAHAWAECNGHYVADDQERCAQFTPVAIYE